MRAAIFVRVSTEDQNFERQIDDLASYAKVNGLEIVEIIKEKISGAKKNVDRPGIQRLIALAQTGEIGKVLVSEVSRMGRNTREVLNVMEDLTDLGVSIYIHNFKIETLNDNGERNSMAQMMLTMLAEFGRMERQFTLERSRSGIAKARRDGKHLGRPFGSIKSNQILIDEYKPVVKLLKQGYSLRKVAKLSDVAINTVQKVKRAIPFI